MNSCTTSIFRDNGLRGSASTSARKEFLALPPDIVKTITQAFHTLEQKPRSHQSIKLSGGEGYRLRVGDYRILYEIDDSARKVIVYRVKHRREAYR